MFFWKKVFSLLGVNKKKFVKNSFWLSFGQFFSRLIKFLIVILIARGLKVDDYGKFSYLLALIATWVSLAGIFSNMSVYIKDAVSDGDQKDKFFSVLLFRSSLALVILFLVLLVLYFQNESRILLPILLVFALSAVFDFIKDFFLSRLELKSKMNIESGVIILQSLIIFSLIFLNRQDLTLELAAVSYFAGSVISMILSIIFDLFFSFKTKTMNWAPVFNLNYLKKYIQISAQFGLLYAVIISAFPNFLISFVSYFSGAYNLSGSLNNYLSLNSILTIFPAILMTASLPILSSFQSGVEINRKMRQMGSLFLLIGLPLLFGGIVLGDELIFFFFKQKELLLNYSFCIFLAIPVVYYVILFLQLVLLNNLVKVFFQKMWIPTAVCLLSSMIPSFFNITLVPFSYLFFYVGIFFIFIIFFKFRLKDVFDFSFIYKILIFSILMFLLLIVLNTLSINLWVSVLCGAAFYVFTLFLERKKLLFNLLENN